MGRPRKDAILEKALEAMEASGILEPEIINMDIQDVETSEAEVIKRPRYTDPAWHDFVMSQFVPEELDPKGNPKVDGLRRVCEALLGEIIESRPVQSSSSPDLAAVNWILRIAWACENPYIDMGSNTPLPERIFGAFCDACSANCKPPYNKFLASLSDTRAESKALRRSLRLRCISAEEAELGETNTFEDKVSDGSYKGESPINEQQKMMLAILSQRNGIDSAKLVSKEFPGKTIDNITKENAANLIILLNRYQTSVKNGSEEVPEDIKVV